VVVFDRYSSKDFEPHILSWPFEIDKCLPDSELGGTGSVIVGTMDGEDLVANKVGR
jgi:hypothetical protein